MKLQLINTLGKVHDSITTDSINELVEWAKNEYKESYSFRWADSNYRVWEINCIDFYPEDITYETFKFIV